jgi:predicted Zn-dependent protease
LRHTLAWLAKAAAEVAEVVLALVAILLLVKWREHNTAIALPTPTGPFAVGRATYARTNEAEADELALPPG